MGLQEWQVQQVQGSWDIHVVWSQAHPIVSESGVRGGGPGDAGTADGGEAAVDPGSGDESGDVGGCWCCCVGDDGLGKCGEVVLAVRATEVRALAISWNQARFL